MFTAAFSDSELSLCNYCIVHNCPVDIIRDLMSDPLMLMLFGSLHFLSFYSTREQLLREKVIFGPNTCFYVILGCPKRSTYTGISFEEKKYR